MSTPPTPHDRSHRSESFRRAQLLRAAVAGSVDRPQTRSHARRGALYLGGLLVTGATVALSFSACSRNGKAAANESTDGAIVAKNTPRQPAGTRTSRAERDSPKTGKDAGDNPFASAALNLDEAMAKLDAQNQARIAEKGTPLWEPPSPPRTAAPKPAVESSSRARAKEFMAAQAEQTTVAQQTHDAFPYGDVPGLSSNVAADAEAAQAGAASATRARSELAAQMAALLRPDAEAMRAPLLAALPLIALETIQPGAAERELAQLTRTLTPDEAAAVNGLRDTFARISENARDASDRTALAAILSRQVAALGGSSSVPAGSADPTQDESGTGDTRSAGIRLGTVALCKRVESFGRYTPFDGGKFLAGRPVSLIVYTEVRNFAQNRVGGGGGAAESEGHFSTTNDLAPPPPNRASLKQPQDWSVELGQELCLYQDADGSRQWRQPELVCRDTARARRNDYFLVQRIDLPATLSVGKYNLKVTVRDCGSKTGGLAEHSLPIEIIADSSAITASSANALPIRPTTDLTSILDPVPAPHSTDALLEAAMNRQRPSRPTASPATKAPRTPGISSR